MLQQPPVNFDVEERLRRLEADKDSLQLQVTVLTEQIEVQTDKISDLEKLLEEKKMQLANAEDVLQRVSGIRLVVATSDVVGAFTTEISENMLLGSAMSGHMLQLKKC